MLKPSLLFALLLVLGPAQAASFDCAKAGTPVERLVCANAELSALDDDLAEIYKDALARDDTAPRLRAAQKAWLAARGKCSDVRCVKERYEDRITELACDQDSPLSGSAVGANRCNRGELARAERQLAPLLAQRRQQVLGDSNNREYAAGVLADEEKAWRAWRDARCALHGETEGGSDGWKGAFASGCMLTETQARIAALKKALR